MSHFVFYFTLVSSTCSLFKFHSLGQLTESLLSDVKSPGELLKWLGTWLGTDISIEGIAYGFHH